MNALNPKTDQPLLVSRKDAARLLGNVSTATVMRLEKIGRIKRVRLDPTKKNGQAFYRVADLVALTKTLPNVG